MLLRKILNSLFLVVVLSSCNSMGSGQNAKPVSAEEFQKKIEAGGVQLIDVRTPEEYAERHLKDAVNMNFNADDFISKIEKLDKTKPVLVYCLSGGRSSKACALLTQKGYTNVTDLEGGILAWTAAGKAIESPNKAEGAKQGLSMDDYLAKVKSDKLVLVDFNAVWCGPCKKLKPILEKAEKKNKDQLEVLPIDVDQNPALSDAMHIKGIPLLIMYKAGKEVWRQTGLVELSDIEEQVKLNSK